MASTLVFYSQRPPRQGGCLMVAGTAIEGDERWKMQYEQQTTKIGKTEDLHLGCSLSLSA